jgi:hypothetical protein
VTVTEEELRDLDRKVKQLRVDYERYFLGTRPREPILLRGDVEKQVVILANQAILNTALRFKFQSICARYQAMKRQWNEVLRRIEQGTYERHRFKANLHARERDEDEGDAGAAPAAPAGRGDPDLFQEYRDARVACGQGVENLTRAKLDQILQRERAKLQEKFGADARFRFRVAVENGRVKLKASRVSSGS